MPFQDMDSRPGWEQDAVAAAVEAGLMLGDGDGNFRPLDPVKRVELAAVAVRLLNKMQNQIIELWPEVSGPERVRLLKEATVRVSTPNFGTAFCFSSGKLATAWHVVSGGNVRVERPGELNLHLSSNWIEYDGWRDFAVISDPVARTPLKWASKSPSEGETVWIYGCGAGQEPLMIPAVWGPRVTNTYADSSESNQRFMIMCAGLVQPGDSGGPVVNARGELVSMVLSALGGSSRIWLAPYDVMLSWFLPRSG